MPRRRWTKLLGVAIAVVLVSPSLGSASSKAEDGGPRLAFVLSSSSGEYAIAVSNADGTDRTVLAGLPLDWDVLDLEWARDTESLVFTYRSRKNWEEDPGQIGVVGVNDPSISQPVWAETARVADSRLMDLTFSPDGSSVAVLSHRHDGSSLEAVVTVVDVKSNERVLTKRIPDTGMFPYELDWTEDGLYVSMAGGDYSELRLADFDGPELWQSQPVATGLPYSPIEWDITDDGSVLGCLTEQEEDSVSSTPSRLVWVDMDTGHETELFVYGHFRWKVPTSVSVSGQYLAFGEEEGDAYVTFVFDRITKELISVVRDCELPVLEPERHEEVSERSDQALLCGFDSVAYWGGLARTYGLGFLHWPIGYGRDEMTDHGWRVTDLKNEDASTAQQSLPGRSVFVFDGHGAHIALDGQETGIGIGFDDDTLMVTDSHARSALSDAWSNAPLLSESDLSALQVAVFVGCGTGMNPEHESSLLGQSMEDGADIAVGFSRDIDVLFEEWGWTRAFFKRAVEQGLDVETAARRAQQDIWTLLGEPVVVRTAEGVDSVFIDQAPPRVVTR